MKDSKKFYRIRSDVFWGAICVTILLMILIDRKEEIYDMLLRGGGREEISLIDLTSQLENQDACYLCGKNDKSLMDYYREFDAIGLIILNDWYVMGFQLQEYDEEGRTGNSQSGTRFGYGNIGGISYTSEENPSRGRASIEIDLSKGSKLDVKKVQKWLCQICLEKVTKSLEYSKWKKEEKDVVPLCLVDFETLEIYSLQDYHREYQIRDYWVEIVPKEQNIEIKAYYLPERGIDR